LSAPRLDLSRNTDDRVMADSGTPALPGYGV
jgi:hypothetical protein